MKKGKVIKLATGSLAVCSVLIFMAGTSNLVGATTAAAGLLLSTLCLAVLVLRSRTEIQLQSRQIDLHEERLQSIEGNMRLAQAEKQKLLTAVTFSPVAVCILNAKKEFEYSNPKFLELTLYSEQEIAGRNFHLLRSDKSDEGFYGKIWTGVHDNGNWSGDMPCKRKDASDLWMHVVMTPIISQEGSISNYLAVMEDITKRLETQKRLEEALLEASAASKAKGEFLANITHEIRTSMNAIMGFTDILARRIKDPTLQKYMDSLKSSGRVLLDLINNILELSRLESGRIDLHPEPTDIRKLISRIVEFFHYKAGQKGIELRIEVSGDVPDYLVIDPNRISQILLNLVGNAVKFTKTGFVEISLKKKKCADHAAPEKIDIEFNVRDSGTGINSHDLNRIFGSFEQATDPEASKEASSGLGLAITRHIVRAMRGEISVKSKKGAGSTFTVSLPGIEIASASDDLANLQMSINDYQFEKAKILVADDTPSNREILKELFLDYPFEVFFATNGNEAIQMSEELHPDLILMDIKMPGVDGFAAAANLKKRKSTEMIPLIALTGSTIDFERTLTQDLWSGQLLKPVTLESLIEAIARILPHSSVPRQIEHNQTPLWSSLDSLVSSCNRKAYQAVQPQLEKFGQQASELQSSISMDLIEAFALKLKEFSNEKGLENLASLCEILLGELQMFEIERIKIILGLISEFKAYKFT